ncbi:MAG: hypothetical protein JO197_05655 [Acidobacteria bacterium]|nr:hypothetical protein [Acidobacteriota bacterium]MBV9475977.1 hypothetical protein [Acidobacteriota bacterium]
MPARLFLLSPANLGGLRAKQLMSPRARFALAMQYQTPEGVPIGDAFAFMSALYFRGKIAYARRFAVPSPLIGGDGIFIITSGYGLVPPDWRITAERMKRMRKIDVDLATRNYVKPLREHAQLLARALDTEGDANAEVVLLGSVATGKYVDVLWPILGSRLRFPIAFAGLGDMARGGLMLRAARAGIELQYTTLDASRKRPPGATGKMPPLE